MKYHLLLTALCAFPLLLSAQKANEQIIKSEVNKVRLFPTSGELEHTVQVKLTKGRNKLIFSGISAYADPSSIQLTGAGKYRIVSTSTEIDFLAAEQFNPRIGILKDSLENMKDRYQANKDLINAYNAELGLLNSNRDLGGEQQNITVAQLREAADFFRSRTLEVNKLLSRVNKEQRELDNRIDAMRYQLTELNYTENQRSNQVIVLIDCDESYSENFTLKYLVSDCGWAAMYDLSATDLSQPIHLKYKAQVYNNTGNAWKNIALTLSTADPRLSAAHPQLSPWHINYASQANEGTKYYVPKSNELQYRSVAENEITIANRRAYDSYMLDKESNDNDRFARNSIEWTNITAGKNPNAQNVQMKQIEISELTAEFPIAQAFSCPSDSKPYLVEIKEMDIPATFTHISVPKLDQGAFLLANIVGWQDLDLMPGPTNVYFAGNFVGVSEINTKNVSDTLALSFGRDSRIQVARKLKTEMTTRKIVGSNRKDTYVYDIVLRNNRQVPIRVNVYDQIPVSGNSDISVSVETVSGGKQDDSTGEVKWEIVIQPGETQNLQIGYSVRYPKNAKIQMRTYRTISAPSF